MVTEVLWSNLRRTTQNKILKYSKNQFYVRIQIVPVKEGSKSGWFEDPSRDEGRKMRARRTVDECR